MSAHDEQQTRVPRRPLSPQMALPPTDVRGVALAVVVGAADLVVFWEPDLGASPVVVAVLAVVGYGALVWRAAAPLPVFTVALAQLVAAYLVAPGYRPTLGLLLALYTVAASQQRWRTVIAAVLSGAAL